MKQIEFINILWRCNSLPYTEHIAELACACHNLGIAEIKNGNVFFKSADRARQFINATDKAEGR